MLAWLLRGVLLVLVAAALLFGVWQWRAGHPVVAVVGAVLIAAVHVTVLAIEATAMHLCNRNDPAPRARIRDVLRAWWDESIVFAIVFAWRQPFRTSALPDLPQPDAARGRRGIVFIHGYMCNRAMWLSWFARLRRLGVPYTS